jgi:hypothetical protein
MLALGACLVDDPHEQFAAIIKPISEAALPEAMQVVGHDLAFFTIHGKDPREAMDGFRDWLRAKTHGKQPILVGFNAAFDWSFVNWYLLTFGEDNPFGISALDIKAYYAGMSGVEWDETRSSKLPEMFRPMRVHSHDALADAIEQAEMFSRMRAHVRALSDKEEQGRRNDIAKRERAANLQATQHAALRDFYGTWSITLTVSALLLTALLIALSLASDETAREAFAMSPIAFKVTNATIALLAFSLVLVQLVWRPDSRHHAHKAAVNHYTNAKFEFRKLLKQTYISEMDAAVAEARYLDVRDLPSIPERWFLRLKEWHQKKLAASRRLDD